jgi:5-methylcytosine-specific restriction enzyme A
MRARPTRIATHDTRAVSPPPKPVNPFYASKEWRALVASLIQERGRRCQDCGRSHDKDGKPVMIYGDHVIEMRDGGAGLDRRNVRLMCAGCHTAKTARERARRMAARPTARD